MAMIRVLDCHDIDSETKYFEFAGLSTDEKPDGSYGDKMQYCNGEVETVPVAICTGSVFIEVDTGSVYMFDEDGPNWDEIGVSLSSDDSNNSDSNNNGGGK